MSGKFFYIAVLVPASVLLPICVAGLTYKRLERPQKAIFFYLIFAGIVDGVSSYMSVHRIGNLWLLHVYTAVETVMLLWFYRSILVNGQVKRVIDYLMVLFPLVCAANIIWGQGMLRYNTYTRPVEALILIYMGLTCFFERSQAPVDSRLGLQKAISWFNAGILLYFSAAFFIFIFSNYLVHGNAFSLFIIVCHATFVLLMYVLFTIGFLQCRN
jgi:hypothetical protein